LSRDEGKGWGKEGKGEGSGDGDFSETVGDLGSNRFLRNRRQVKGFIRRRILRTLASEEMGWDEVMELS
jgi:hypothetical protein